MNMAVLAFCMLPASAAAQDYRPLTETVGNFKGMANEVRKSNPVLSITSGEGIAETIKNLKTGRRKPVAGPVGVALPKAQQDELDRRLKAQELAAERAKRGPRKSIAQPVSTPKLATEPMPPVVLLAIFSSPLQKRGRVVSEESLNSVQSGQSKESLLAVLGKPNATRGVAGLETGSRETLIYNLDGNHSVNINLAEGKVVGLERR